MNFYYGQVGWKRKIRLEINFQRKQRMYPHFCCFTGGQSNRSAFVLLWTNWIDPQYPIWSLAACQERSLSSEPVVFRGYYYCSGHLQNDLDPNSYDRNFWYAQTNNISFTWIGMNSQIKIFIFNLSWFIPVNFRVIGTQRRELSLTFISNHIFWVCPKYKCFSI